MSFKDLLEGTQIGHGTASNGLSIGFGKGGLSISANFNQRLQQKLTTTKPNPDALRNLYTDAGATEKSDIIFPLDIDYERYLMIRRIERVRQKENGNEEEQTLQRFVLPIPSNLNPTYNVNYKDQPMGIAGALASGTLSNEEAMMGGATMTAYGKAAWQAFTEGDKDAKQTATGLGVVTGAAAIGKFVGGNIGSVLGLAAGGAGTFVQGLMSRANQAFNSHMAVLFDGMGFRNFQFGYRFVPRDYKESKALQNLIFQLKQGMHPSLPKENKFLFEYPDEFRIEFCYAVQPNMFKIKRCVLKDLSVTYNGDGVPRFFEDGSPVVVDIQMTFQEVEIVTKEDFKNVGDSA